MPQPLPPIEIHVAELPLALEEVTRDPFLDNLEPARPSVAPDAHERQVARVRASLLTSGRPDRPTHRRWA
jgi:hypothetical protein